MDEIDDFGVGFLTFSIITKSLWVGTWREIERETETLETSVKWTVAMGRIDEDAPCDFEADSCVLFIYIDG